MEQPKKEEIELNALVKRHLSEIEKQYIEIKMEKLRLDREKTSMVFNKGLFLYFSFVVLGIFGVSTRIMDQYTLYTLILIGIFVLIVAVVPYIMQNKKAEDDLNKMLDYLMHER